MNNTPQISVVMGVRNGGSRLAETIDSVLSQEDVSLEFIVVNDGSTDQTAQMLDEYSRRDSRLKIITQQNQGLTRALIEGCTAATGKYLARQDAGDLSLPGRLRMQLDALRDHSGASVVSGGTRFVGPEREQLYEVVPTRSDLTSSLLELELDRIAGPSMHGCTMFAKATYERVGGYRASFYFAQDLDLWIRMAEIGTHLAIHDVVYEASLTIGAISSRYRKQQVETARLILESARLRRSGKSDQAVLQKASRIRSNEKSTIGRLDRAKALYFIGACLRRRRSPEALRYFQRAFLTHPLHLKSALRVLTG